MFLKEIHLRNFRNYTDLVLRFSPMVNILLGENGQGKTNLLEAIYFLSTLRSFRTSRREELLQWGKPRAYLKGVLQHPLYAREVILEVFLEERSRHLRINGKEPATIGEFLGLFTTFVFFPDSLLVIKGGPAERRKFFDRGIYNLNPRYLHLVQEYNHALKQRNSLLKTAQVDQALFEVWTKQYTELGTEMLVERLQYLHELSYDLQQVGKQFWPEQNSLAVVYHSSCGADFSFPLTEQWDAKERCVEEMYIRLQAHLHRREREERRRAQSLVGPHRDDLTFLLNGKDLRLYGSQGEQRIFMFLLTLAMLQNFTRQQELLPVVLLDDVVSELDDRRRRIVFDFLAHVSQQVFVTSAEPVDFSVVREQKFLYRVEAGGVQRW